MPGKKDDMTNVGSTSGDVFDVRRVRRLVELMNEYDLSEIDLRQTHQRIRLRKGSELPLSLPATAAPAAAAAAPAALTPPAGAASDAADAKYVVSPMVGTFYSAASPDAPPFAKVGDRVGPETIVCIIEAMKVFNEIPAECAGKIVALLVENGDAVEYGQKLFRVE